MFCNCFLFSSLPADHRFVASALKRTLSRLQYSCNPQLIDLVVTFTMSSIKNNNEIAMFLAHCIHETAGLSVTEEVVESPTQYGVCVPGKSYHGRGFLHISYPENYRLVGNSVGVGDLFLRNPEYISNDPVMGVKVSIAFWKDRVMKNKIKTFLDTTRAINWIEVEKKDEGPARRRYEIYLMLARELKLKSVLNPY